MDISLQIPRVLKNGLYADTIVSTNGSVYFSVKKSWRMKYKTWRDYYQEPDYKMSSSFPLKAGPLKKQIHNCPDDELLMEVNLSSNDGKYWKSIKKKIYEKSAEFNNTYWAKVVYKTIRRRRNDLAQTSWDEYLDKKTVDWACNEIQEKSDGYLYADSFRCGKIGNKISMKKFYKARSCCGSSEWSTICPIDKNTYILGFNYGH